MKKRFNYWSGSIFAIVNSKLPLRCKFNIPAKSLKVFCLFCLMHYKQVLLEFNASSGSISELLWMGDLEFLLVAFEVFYIARGTLGQIKLLLCSKRAHYPPGRA